MCIYNRLIHNPKYKPNKKNKGAIPLIYDPRIALVPIGCGRCIECMKQRARQWQVRLLEEVKTSKNGIFITLTFSNESICKIIQQKQLTNIKGYALDNAIATHATRLWLERWRKKFKKSLKHWLVTELGHHGTENIHLHGIIWTDEHINDVRNTWQYGYIWPRKETTVKNYVNASTVNYITKYLTKVDFDHKYYKPKILTSPGIGKEYITYSRRLQHQYLSTGDTRDHYTTDTGHTIQMPIYWRNKLYTEEERELLWLEKLDKQKRFVLGQEIDVSQNFDLYTETIELARLKNTELGYGSSKTDYNQKQYEEQIREIMYNTRIQKTKSIIGQKPE